MELLHRNHRRRSIRGCWHRCLQPHRCCWHFVHIIVKIIVISIFFSSFNGVDLLRSMSADCCMPRCQEWGTMAAVGGLRPPWLACVCILPSLASIYLGFCVRCPPTQYPTNNQPPSRLNISISNGRMTTLQVTILFQNMLRTSSVNMAQYFYGIGKI